jgi:hypothetical protein
MFFLFSYRLNTYGYYIHEQKYIPFLQYKKEMRSTCHAWQIVVPWGTMGQSTKGSIDSGIRQELSSDALTREAAWVWAHKAEKKLLNSIK